MGTKDTSVDAIAEKVLDEMSDDQKNAVRNIIETGWTKPGQETDNNAFISLVISLAPGKGEDFHGQVMSKVKQLISE